MRKRCWRGPGSLLRDVSAWLDALPEIRKDFRLDSAACSKFWSMGRALRGQLPGKAARNPHESLASEAIHRKERAVRDLFLASSRRRALRRCSPKSGREFPRVEQLVQHAARLVPGLTPDGHALAAEKALALKEKEGLEIDHGILLSHVLSASRERPASVPRNAAAPEQKRASCSRSSPATARSILVLRT